MAECYKVCSTDGDGNFWSARVPHEHTAVCLPYNLGETTIARFGGCICFRVLTQAIAFLHWFNPEEKLVIFRADGQEELSLPVLGSCSDPEDHLREIWEGKHQSRAASWPEGTVAYRRVTLLEQVYDTREDDMVRYDPN